MMRDKLTSEIQPLSISKIIAAVESTGELNCMDAMNIVLQSKVTEDDLSAFVDFEHAADDSYGKLKLYHGKFFEVFIRCWRAGDFSAIHDEGLTSWGAIKVFGRLNHTSYNKVDDTLSTQRIIQLNEGNILGIKGNAIHQMGNPTNEPVFSLHLYGLDEEQYVPDITQDLTIFDLTKNIAYKTNHTASYELDEHLQTDSSLEIKGDFPTWLINLVRQINRNKKMGRFNRLKGLLNELRSAEKREYLSKFLSDKVDYTGEFLDPFHEKVFTTAIIGIGKFIDEDYKDYHPSQQIYVQRDKSDSIFIVKIDDKHMILDYSHDKLVIS